MHWPLSQIPHALNFYFIMLQICQKRHCNVSRLRWCHSEFPSFTVKAVLKEKNIDSGDSESANFDCDVPEFKLSHESSSESVWSESYAEPWRRRVGLTAWEPRIPSSCHSWAWLTLLRCLLWIKLITGKIKFMPAPVGRFIRVNVTSNSCGYRIVK